jgi:hypothetical protein
MERLFLTFRANGAILTRTDNLAVSSDSKNWYAVRVTLENGWGEDPPTAVFSDGLKTYGVLPSLAQGTVSEFDLPSALLRAPCFSFSIFSGNLRTSLPVWISVRKSGYREELTEVSEENESLYQQLLKEISQLKAKINSIKQSQVNSTERSAP